MGDTTDLLADRARVLGGKPSPREMDALITTGEQQSAALLVMTMESLGIPAVSLAGWQAGIYTDCRYGDSDIRLIAPVRIREALSGRMRRGGYNEPWPRRLGHDGGRPRRGA